MLEIRNIETHPYDEKLFNNDTLTLTNKATVLSGPNGYGKTTLIRELKNALKANGAIEFDNNPRSRKLAFSASEVFRDEAIHKDASIGFLSYDSHADDYSSTISKNLFNENFAQVALRKTSSEGQNNLMSLMDLFDNAQAIAKEHQQLRQLVIFVDGYPDDPDPLTILFDTEATINDPEDLPQLFIDLANELNDVKEKEKL